MTQCRVIGIEGPNGEPLNYILFSVYREDIRKLEEENEKLKSDLSLVIKERDDNIKQNKKLKSDLAFKNTMLDNVKAEYENLQDVIKSLKEKIRFLEQCLDNKEKVNKSLREENKKLKENLESLEK